MVGAVGGFDPAHGPTPESLTGGFRSTRPTRTLETRRPMTAEQQLERSVLEGKERDELHAIAQALSVKTNTRTKKADMIDGILKATGVSVDDGTPAAATSGTNGDGTDGGTANGRRPTRSGRSSGGQPTAESD